MGAILMVLISGCATKTPTGNGNADMPEQYEPPELPAVETYNVNDFVKGQLLQAQGELQRFWEAYGRGGNIVGVHVINDYLPTENNVVYIDDIAGNLHIILSCALTHATDFALKLLVDYQEEPFYIDGMVYDTVIFQVNAFDVKELAFQLANTAIDLDKSHILTVIAIPDAYKNVGTDDGLLQRVAYSVDYELSKPDRERTITRLSRPSEPDRYLNIPYQGIMLNTDFDAVDVNFVNFPPKTITVKAGETVTLAYRAGNYEDSDDIIFYVFAGFEQLKIDGKRFLNITNRAGKISFGTFDFIAPAEAGKYDITAFVSSAPYEARNANNAHINDCARRFTLIVE
jgi:hypothetical protein